ncbi:MAG: MBL fold metallo-hydrolase [Chloroflexi bacterium]|nr:MBL fold metallo-hydrolase [Chloroflexota bacterium]
MKLLDGLYGYIWPGRGNNCNSYLIAGEVLTLIDPGHLVNEFREPCLDHLVSEIKKDGFEVKDLGLIINTHGHPDHSQANAALAEKSGARVAMHQAEEEHIRQMSKLWGQRQPDPTVDFYLEEGDLSLGKSNKIDLRIYHTPGHSPGSVCCYWPERKALITGDLIFAMSVGRTDFPGGDFRLLRESIDRMAQLDVECLLPGHMGVVQGKDKVQKNFTYIKMAFPLPNA